MTAHELPRGRDHRLDVFRGLALLTIFVNHVPGQAFERLTSRNFGFSDAAEAFVLMSGIAVGLAYSRGFRSGAYGEAVLRVWRRASTLYVTHVVTSVVAIAIIAAGVLYLDTIGLVKGLNFTRFIDRPLEAMIGVPTLGHQLGYFNILPLYFTLLIVSPVYLVVGIRNRWAMVGLAAVLWLAAGLFRLNLPNYPNPGGWFFNPLAWQLIYVIGIAGGLAASQGHKLVPYNRVLFGLAVSYLVLSLLWMKLQMGGLPGGRYVPFFIGGFDKTFLSLPRLAHALALAYVMVNIGAVSRLLAMAPFRPVALMGRHGLAVFATGSVLAIALQVLRARFETTVMEDAALLTSGIVVQYAVARFISATRSKKPAISQALVEPVVPAVTQSQSGTESRPISAS